MLIQCSSGKTYEEGGVLSQPSDIGEIVFKLAEAAVKEGTFGVGGVLLDKHGKIYKFASNKVVKDGRINDPTAHAERQLVDWYNENKSTLPPPEDMLLVGSFEPCLMCGCALCESKIKMLYLAKDTIAGVDYSGADFEGLSGIPKARKWAQESISGMIDDNGKYKPLLSLFGADETILDYLHVSAEARQKALDIHEETNQAVCDLIHHTYDRRELVNPVELKTSADDQDLLQQLRFQYNATYQNLFGGKHPILESPKEPNKELCDSLIDMALSSKQNGNEYNASALVDPFGNVLMISGGQESSSATRTSLMELIRAYCSMRSELGRRGEKYFPPPKDCTIYSLYPPQINPKGLMEVGAIGSSLEGAIPNDNIPLLEYFCAPDRSHEKLFEKAVQSTPPFYTDVVGLSKSGVFSVCKNQTLAQYASDRCASLNHDSHRAKC